MKKLIGTVAVAAMLATAAFAEITVSGWGRGIWAPIGYDGDAKMTYGTSWGNLPRVGINVAGESENIGFLINFQGDGGVPGINDNAHVWGKPWDWLKITVGQFHDNMLRIDGCFGAFDWLRGGALGVGEDFTFKRIAKKGAEIALTPVDGLYIAAGFDIEDVADRDFVDILKVGQYAAGYKIEDLLAIKAQYIGDIWRGEALDYDDGIINVGVDLLMIENNFISIGAFIPTDFDKDAVTIAATYTGGFDALTLHAIAQADINGKASLWLGEKDEKGNEKESSVDATNLTIGVGVDYDLGNGLKIQGDVRTQLYFPEDYDAAGHVTIGAFFSKSFSNGDCGIGAQVAIPFGDSKFAFTTLAANDGVSVVIPVRVGFNF